MQAKDIHALVVENDDYVRRMLVDGLSEIGVGMIDHVCNPESAIELVKYHPYNLAILDSEYRLWKNNAAIIGVAKLLRHDYPQAIIVSTSLFGENFKLWNGVSDEFIIKPYGFLRIWDKIAEYILGVTN